MTAPAAPDAERKFDKQLSFLLATMADDPSDDSRRDVLRVSEALAQSTRTTVGFNPWPRLTTTLAAQSERTQRTFALAAFEGLAGSMREKIDNYPTPSFGGGGDQEFRTLTGTVQPDRSVVVPGIGPVPFTVPDSVPAGAQIGIAVPVGLIEKVNEVKEEGGKVPDWLTKLGDMAERNGQNAPPGLTDAANRLMDAAPGSEINLDGEHFLKHETFSVNPNTGEVRMAGGKARDHDEDDEDAAKYPKCPGCGRHHPPPDDSPLEPTEPADAKIALAALFDWMTEKIDTKEKSPRAILDLHAVRGDARELIALTQKAGHEVVGLPDEAVQDVWDFVTDRESPANLRQILGSFLAFQRAVAGIIAERR